MRPTKNALAALALVACAAAAQASEPPAHRDPATLPGLTDAHYHLRGVGERELTLSLADARSLVELQEQLHPEQAVTWDEAVKMFTAWPAYAAFED